MQSTDIDVARQKVADKVKLDVLSPKQLEQNEKQMKSIARTFISDTVTAPTKEMYAYAVMASLGDDVFHDETTAALEKHVAQLFGKEAALLVPSGTMSNQLALRTHLHQPPYSVLCDHRGHINRYEAGGAAFHSGATVIAVIPSNRHHLTLDDVKENVVVGDDPHFAPTHVITLENPLNGTIIPQDEVIAISDYAKSEGMKTHLDGARIWHVAAETGKPLDELVGPFDSVSVCFSKGLGAPAGSCLVGPADFIKKARWFRKLFGGGMRQTGILAASAAYALTHNYPRLPRVHSLARKLESGLEEIGVEISSRAETCMVFYDPSPLGFDYAEIAERAASLPEPIHLAGSRVVVHIQTTEEAVTDFLAIVRELAEEKKVGGFISQEKPEQNGTYRDVYVQRKLVKKDL